MLRGRGPAQGGPALGMETRPRGCTAGRRGSPFRPGTFDRDGASHRDFYVFDPSGLNVEVVVRA